MPRAIDLTGQRFGRLVAQRDVGTHPRHGRIWLCACDCGGAVDVVTNALRTGNTESCGCATIEATVARSTKHGHAPKGRRRERLYRIWRGMRQRCSDPNSRSYRYYGERGIAPCSEWSDFEVFRSWALTNGYADHLTLERRENDLGYTPSNCRWATYVEQAANRRTSAAAIEGRPQ